MLGNEHSPTLSLYVKRWKLSGRQLTTRLKCIPLAKAYGIQESLLYNEINSRIYVQILITALYTTVKNKNLNVH